MRRELLMPKLGLTMTEGLLSEWVVPEGGAFQAGAPIFLVETEKVVTEIEAERSGVLLQVVVQAGETVPVGTLVGYWDDGAGAGDARAPDAGAAGAGAAGAGEAAGAAKAAALQPSAAGSAGVPSADARSEAAASAPAGTAGAGGVARAAGVARTDGARIVATPLARRIAAAQGIDLAAVRGSGPRGRIKAADVVEAARSTAPAAPAATAPASTAPAAAAPASAAFAPAASAPPAPGAAARPPAPVHVTPVAPTAVQLATAKRLTAVKASVPHFYLSLDVDVRRLLALREELNGFGVERLTLNHFIVAALGRALRDEPAANRVWIDDQILQFETSDVGVAVDTGRGLFVPVLRDAGGLALVEVARRTQALVERARDGGLSVADTSGGAVTVSNAGMHGVAYMTPIINPGQAMILGVGSVRELFRPDAEGRPELRREIGLVLACDHRILDGVAGLRFLNRVASYLEQPLKLVLGA